MPEKQKRLGEEKRRYGGGKKAFDADCLIAFCPTRNSPCDFCKKKKNEKRKGFYTSRWTHRNKLTADK